MVKRKQPKRRVDFSQNRIFVIGISLLLVFILGAIFAFRYTPSIMLPNFYGEDGTVFIYNLLQNGLIEATLTAFNGYLVVGQYLIADAAYIVYSIFSLPFSSLPVIIAIFSYLFLGLTASLPFILFRREMGWTVALITSILLAFTPLVGSDYAIIGTIGNLKFAFLFWAVLFIIWRNVHYRNIKKVILADVILLLCVLTNGPVVAILPFILWSYRNEILALIRNRKWDIKFIKRPEVISALILLAISALYLAIVYIKGIPTIPNYLTAPYVLEATENIIYRVTLYGWLFPVSKGMTDVASMAILGIALLGVFLLNRQRRAVFLFGLIAISISTLAFVVTRPGIGDFMLIYEKFPDQFFYAQSMVFVFITMWVIAPYVRTLQRRLLLGGIATIFIIASNPYGSSFGENQGLYKDRPDIYGAVELACKQSGDEKVTIPIYPYEPWSMVVDRKIACD